jgi:hypothetical protein
MKKNAFFPVFLFVAFSLFFSGKLFSQVTFYDLGTIQKIEVYFSFPDWDYRLDTAKHGAEGYVMADWVKINGAYYDSVGIKYKGNSSFDSTYEKNPVHISLDEFKNQSYQGIKDIKLGNGYSDPSMIREVLGYNMLKNYMDCPRANFAQLYINGMYTGLYANDESINKKFCADHFYSSVGTFIKCNPVVNPGPTTKSNLKFISTGDSSSYFNYYEIKSDYGWNDLRALCDSVTNNTASLENVMDLDRVTWMLAFNNVLVNLDSYTGVFCQNYYLYRDNTNRYNPLVWDLNMCLGGFPYIGSGGTAMGSLTVTNMQQLTPLAHSTDPYWPLINAVMNNPMYKRMYIAHMRTITSEMFSSGAYLAQASQYQALIDTAVISDSNKFFTYTQFQNGMTANTIVGSYTVPGISNLMSARVTYLQSTPEFTAAPPVISNVASSTTAPAVNSLVSFTASVANANFNAVYIGYRYNENEKFTRVLMYDDGLHNDGAAADNVFGIELGMVSGKMQYYIYAENSNAGIFSPGRAEHEFYILKAVSVSPAEGDLVFNEILADNNSGEKDEYDDREDWIELYNNSASLLSLDSLYLTDDVASIVKWKFPAGTTINPYSFLTVWADDDNTEQVYHTNFNLGNTGETLFLTKNGIELIDTVTFGAQLPDVSIGRCPDGSGTFTTLSSTTFSASNCPVGIENVSFAKSGFILFPNPATQSFNLKFADEDKSEIFSIMNALGETVYSSSAKNNSSVSVSGWAAGIYFVRCGTQVVRLVVQK